MIGEFVPTDPEAATLGAILVDPGQVEAVRHVLPRSTAFFELRHKLIYDAILSLTEQGRRVDFITLADALGDRLTDVGGALYLSQLPNGVVSATGAADYARTVRDHAAKRYVEHVAGKMVAEANNGAGADAAIARALDDLRELQARLEDTTRAQRFEIHLASEALEPQPDIVWPVEGIFSEGSLNLLTGEAGDGKTSAMTDCLVCVALGKRWLGYAVTQSPVLIVDEESGPRRLKRRLGETMRGHGADASLDMYYITLARFDMWDARDVDALQCAIEDCGARFVVIDALADIMPGRDENAVKEVQPVFMALRAIAETTGAAIVVIHHNNRSGGYRGSSAIKGAVDLLLTVEKTGDLLTFKAEKARDADRKSIKFAAKCNWETDIFNLSPAETDTAQPIFNKSQDYVLRYLAEHGRALLADIQGHADSCSDTAAKQAVYALVRQKFVARVDDGGPGEKATYGLTERGRAVYAQPV